MACVGDCYNLTTLTAANSTLEVVTAVNDLTDEWWGRLFLIGLFMLIVLTVTMKTGEPLKGMLSAGFVTTIVGGLFLAAGIVRELDVLASLIITVICALMVYGGGLSK